jgi:ABC-type phosphate transport system substrate-binding protein
VTFVTFNPQPLFKHNRLQVPSREKNVRQHYFRIFTFLLLATSLAVARDIALVSNKTNSLGAVSLPELVKICKAQTSHWPDGKPVTFVMRAPSAPEMKTLIEKVYGMSEGEISSLIATSNHGRPVHPAIVIAASDEELVNKVASTPGAVGVVDVYSINSSVAVVKVAGKLPLEPGYLLHGN